MEDRKILTYFMELLSQIKLFHWSTMSYAKHKALDDLHSVMSEKVDLFVESYIGKYKRQPLKIFEVNIVANTNTSNIENFLDTNREILDTLQKGFSKSSELQNIIQEMMTELNKAIYLCKLS